jgi:hypothetical protein
VLPEIFKIDVRQSLPFRDPRFSHEGKTPTGRGSRVRLAGLGVCYHRRTSG